MKLFKQIFLYLFFPNRCGRCFSSKIISQNEQYLDGYTLCEYDEICGECGNYHDSWAYGSYSEARQLDFKSRIGFIEIMYFPQAILVRRPRIIYGYNAKFVIDGKEYSF